MRSPDKTANRKVGPVPISNIQTSENADENEKIDDKEMNKPPATPAKGSLLRRNSLMRQTNAFKYMYALEQLKSSDENPTTLDDIRIMVKKYMATSFLGGCYENFIILVSIMSAIIYIHETYALNKRQRHLGQGPTLEVFDIVFAAIFGFDWCLNLFLADNKFFYFFSFFSWVDILIVSSIYVTRDHTLPRLNNTNSFYIGMMYSFFGFRTARILRALRCHTKFSGIIDPVDRYVTQMCLYASVFILFFASVMQFLEKHSQALPFHTWIYYTCVTISTVGYGDISPRTAAGRVLAMTIIGCAAISVPFATSELIEKMKLQSFYMRAVYQPKSQNSKHIIICGDISSTSLSDFFAELFHEDHENDDLNAVILLPVPPTVEIILLMQSQKYFLQLTYLEGSALSDNDLRRAKAETASAIFVLTNKFSQVPDEEDAKSILLSLSIKRYIAAFFRPRLHYCIQLLRPENRRHLQRTTTNELDESDIVVCLNEIKMGAMAQSVLYPGANTLLMTLLTSISEENLDIEEEEMKNTVTAPDGTVVAASPLAWFKEYTNGCGWEIYVTKLARVFDGAKFCDLSWALYNKKGVVLFALQLKNKKIPGATRIVLNPGSFTIPSQDQYDIDAFVIARNAATSDLSFSEGPISTDQSAMQIVSRNLGSVAYMMKTAGDVMERRKSSLRDVNKIRSNIVFNNKLDSVGEEPESEKSGGAVKKESRWRALKRSALLERKVQSDSFQEVVHRLEDQHFLNNFYVRSKPVSIDEVRIKTDVITEVPAINNHIIIVAKRMNNLFDLLRPLRSKHLGPLKYIVVLHSEPIPVDVWRRISILDGILLVRGSSLEDGNLKRAGIFRASTVVVVADGSTEEQGHAKDASLVDSDAIFTYQHVKRLNPQTHVVVEIVNESNIGYLEDQNNPSLMDDPRFSIQVAAGSLFTTNLLDSIVCQAYYNPEIVKVINKLIAGQDFVERTYFSLKAAEELGHLGKHDTSSESEDSSSSSDSETEKNSSAKGKEGNDAASVKSGNSSNSKKKKKDKKEDKPKPNEKDLPREILLYKARRKLMKIPNSCLYQISVPSNLEKKTYGALYQHLTTQGIIPLGIYRGVLGMGMGPKANKTPYVFTNPPKETELFACDLIFVLSTRFERPNSKLEIKDWLLNLQMQHNAVDSSQSGGGSTRATMRAGRATQIVKGPNRETIVHATPTVAAPEDQYDLSYKRLENKLKSCVSHFDQKLASIIESMEKVLEDVGDTTITTARTNTIDDATSFISDSTRGANSIDVEAAMSGKFSMDSSKGHRFYGSGEEKKEDYQEDGGRVLSPTPATSLLNTAIPAPLKEAFRKNSMKKRPSLPTVPSILEEPNSAGQSTVQSEEEDASLGQSKSSAEMKNKENNDESRETTNLPALSRVSRPTMVSPNRGTIVVPNKGGSNNRGTIIQPNNTNTKLIGKELAVPPPGKFEKAISSLSADVSLNENDENGDDEEDEIIDTTPLEPIKFNQQSQSTSHQAFEENKEAEGRSIITESHPQQKEIEELKKQLELPLQQTVSLNKNWEQDQAALLQQEAKGKIANEQKVMDDFQNNVVTAQPGNRSRSSSYGNRSSPPFFNEAVHGPKASSVAPLSLDKLAKVKSLTEFTDTKSGKVRSTLLINGKPGSPPSNSMNSSP